MKTFFMSYDDYLAIVHYFDEKNVVVGFRDFLTQKVGKSFGWNVEYIYKGEKKNNEQDEEREDVKLHEFSYDNFYIWDGTNGEDKAELLRGKGYFIWGGGIKSSVIEKDRITAKMIFEQLKIPTPAYEIARNVDELIRVLNSFGNREVVLKANDNRIQTIIATAEELIDVVEENREKFLKVNGFVVEEFKRGKEISCERYLIGLTREIDENLINFTIEAKKFLAGDYGVQTGAEFNLVFPISELTHFAVYAKNPSKVARVLNKIAQHLYDTKELRDVEILDINFIVDFENERYWALEFTPRIGYPGTITFAHILWGNDIAYDTAIKNGVKGNLRGFGFGVRVSVPPYPYKIPSEKEEEKREIDFIDTEIEIEKIEEKDTKFAVDGIEYDEEDECYYIANENLGVVSTYKTRIEDELFDETYNFIKENIDGVIQVRVDGKEWIMKWLNE